MTEQSATEVPPIVQSKRTRTHTIVGLVLVGLSLAAFLNGGGVQMIPLLCAIGFGMTGIAFFAKGQGRSVAWGALGVCPFVGPLLFLAAIAIDHLLGRFAVRSHLRQAVFVAITILGLLTAIAIPNYLSFQHEHAARVYSPIDDAARLGGIAFAAISMYEARKTYIISDMSQLGGFTPPDSHYTFWYAVNGVPTAINTTQPYGSGCDVTTPPTSVKVEASATGFTAAAKGNMDNDATCDEWSINEKKELVHTLDDIKD